MEKIKILPLLFNLFFIKIRILFNSFLLKKCIVCLIIIKSNFMLVFFKKDNASLLIKVMFFFYIFIFYNIYSMGLDIKFKLIL